MSTGKRIASGLGFGMALILAAACGAGQSSAPGARDTTTLPAIAQPGQAAPVPGQGSGSAGSAQGTTGSQVVAPLPPVAAQTEGTKVVRSGQITLEIKNGSFDTQLQSVRALVAREGGIVSATDAASGPDDRIRTGTITFLVPASNFDDAISQLGSLGTQTKINIAGSDVSLQYVDLQARRKNAEAQRDAMLALLSRATSVQDIINIQNQLGQITAQLEQLKGQIAYLDKATSYSTISVTLSEGGAAAPRPADEWGFKTALGDAAHNAVNTVNWIVEGLGAVLPIAAIVLVVAGIFWRRRGRATVAAAPA